MLIITPPPHQPPPPIAHNGPQIELTIGEQDLIAAKHYKKASPFVSALWTLIQEADANNIELIKQVYPSHVEAWTHFKLVPEWWDQLISTLPVYQRRSDDPK